MRWVVVFVASLATAMRAATPARAQDTAATPPAFVHEDWTVRDGLPVNAVNVVAQDRQGYLWLATWDGLIRFDGVRFTVFNTGNSDALPSNRLVDLVPGSDGSLYLRTEQRHVVRWRAGAFTHFAAAHGLRDGSARVLYADATGRLWVGTDAGVRLLVRERFVPVADGAIRGPVDDLLSDASGTLWVGTRADGVYRVRGRQVTRFDTASGLASNRVTRLVQDRAGTVWVGTDAGLHRVRGDRIAPVLGEDGRPVRRFVAGVRVAPRQTAPTRAGGDVWVAYIDGLGVVRGDRLRVVARSPDRGSPSVVRFDPGGAVWYAVADRLYREGRLVFQVPARAPGAERTAGEIRDVAWDREGSVWLATVSSGLFRLKPSLFRVYGDAEGLAGHNVSAVLEDRHGAIWTSVPGWGFSRLADGRITNYTPDRGFPPFVQSLMQTRAGDVWVGLLRGGPRSGGLLRCNVRADGRTAVCTPPRGGQPDSTATVRAMHEDAAGDVWAGTDEGLFRLHDGAWRRVAGAAPGIVRAFLEARDGTLWMGTMANGLLAYRGGRFRRVTGADGLPSDLIRTLYEDSRGRLWVGTEGRGLARVTPAAGRGGVVAIRTIRQRDGLFDEGIHQILSDGLGRLWMSTNRGIFWVAEAELNAFADGRVGRVHSTAYTERDGLRNREANGGYQAAGIRAYDGRLWFATQAGAVVVDPARVGRNLVPPPVVVERVVARGRAMRVGPAPLALAPDERDFEVDYTALSFLAPENVRFRYRLEGLHDAWIEAGNRRTAFYTNVPPGQYTFRVAASNDGGVWNAAGASVALRVVPRFRETRVAQALLALALGLAGVAGYRWRVGRLRRRARELTRLVETRTAQVREHEAQLETQNAQLASQARQLAELDEVKSRLFANLSHEFRTPLTLILGPLRGLLDGRHGALSASAHGQGTLMLRNAQRLLRLIDQILDLTRLQTGQAALDRQPCDVVALAREVTQAFAALGEQRGVALCFRSAVPELVLSVDPGQLEKVLLNLLSNALKFTEAGGGVDVTVGADPGGATIAVRDTGVGIAPDELPRVFERFYQADASVTRRYAGTGIGLALARELVELHGGTIRAESAPGAGSTFAVRLPRGAVAGAADATPTLAPAWLRAARPETGVELDERPHPPAAGAAPADAADRTTVLVVDDHADMRAYARSVLAPTYRVIEAADGRAGLEQASLALPDLIVADVMMPELDGLALARALKADATTDAIPVVLLTARAAPEDQVAGYATGADAYLVKPFAPAVLEACVAGLLAQRRRLRARFLEAAAGPGPEVTSPAPEPVADVPAAPAEPSALVQRLRALVAARLGDPDLDPEALARAAGLSYHQLYRALRDECDLSPSRFIRGVRAECAAELLRQGAGSVTEVAYAVGFQSLSYFSRAFRERFGVPPSAHATAGREPARTTATTGLTADLRL